MTVRITNKRVDQALTLWEDYCFLMSVIIRIQVDAGNIEGNKLDGAIMYSGSFRSWLAAKPDQYLPENFHLWYDNDLCRSIAYMPFSVWLWHMEGQRTFRLQGDYDELLTCSESDARPLNSVRWPLEAFAINLEKPIPIAETDIKIGCLLVSINQWEENPHPIVIVYGLSASLGEESASLSDSSRVRMSKFRDPFVNMSQRPQHVQAANEYMSAYQNMAKLHRDILGPHIASSPWFSFQLDDRTLADFNKDKQAGGYQATCMNLVIGLCRQIAYGRVVLGKRSPDSGETSPHTLSTEDLARNLFQDDVCRTGELGQGGYSVRPHKRKGYYRRPRGSMPDAPKTKWVESTIIHEDRWRSEEALTGSETTVNIGDDKGGKSN